MRIDAISIGKNPPEDVNVIVEVPVGGHPIKYEMDKEAGALVVDRFLYTPMTYPGNYGFVPHTLSEDGDPIDVLIVRRVAPPSDIRHGSLTPRQIDVLRLVADGKSNREIGQALAISDRTVERHLTAVFAALGVDRRSSAVAVATAAGLLPPRDPVL